MEIKQLPTFGCEYRRVTTYPIVADGHYIQKFVGTTYDSMLEKIQEAITSGVPTLKQDQSMSGITTGGISGDPSGYYMVQPSPSERVTEYPHYYTYIMPDGTSEYVCYICFIPKNLLP